MRTKLISFAALLYGCICYAQNTFPATGNAGVGTISPSTNLHIKPAGSNVSGLRLEKLTSSSPTPLFNNTCLTVDALGNVILMPSNFPFNTATSATSSTDYWKKAQVFGAGNPTLFPTWGINRYGFNVFDMFKAPPYMATDWMLVNIVDRGGKERVYFNVTKDEVGTPGPSHMGMIDGAGNELMKFSDGIPGVFYLHMPKAGSRIIIGGWGADDPTYKFVVANGNSLFKGDIITNSSGRIGIGTSSFTDGGDNYKLAVNGAIRAHRVKVYTTWADYVFNEDYDLPSLEEVEEHIDQCGHLQDIPSATEVEANGIELGEMNKLLLQKVEELTLYLIELNKKLKDQQAQIDVLTNN